MARRRELVGEAEVSVTNKAVRALIVEVQRYAKAKGLILDRVTSGGDHHHLVERATGKKIIDEAGLPVTFPNSPSDWRWEQNLRAELRRLELLPPIERKAIVERARIARLPLLDRLGRAFRTDLPIATRRALLREVSNLLNLDVDEDAA